MTRPGLPGYRTLSTTVVTARGAQMRVPKGVEGSKNVIVGVIRVIKGTLGSKAH